MPTERHGAAHRIKSWRPVTGHTNTSGSVVSAKDLGEQPYEHYVEVTQEASPQGPRYSAGVDYVDNVAAHGTETSQYRTGSFRTQRRAEIAGESLANRAYSGKAEMYRTGSYYESADERRANREGLL